MENLGGSYLVISKGSWIVALLTRKNEGVSCESVDFPTIGRFDVVCVKHCYYCFGQYPLSFGSGCMRRCCYPDRLLFLRLLLIHPSFKIKLREQMGHVWIGAGRSEERRV